jgi:hypothetical protein
MDNERQTIPKRELKLNVKLSKMSSKSPLNMVQLTSA